MNSESNQVRILDPQLTTLTAYTPAEGGIAPSGDGASGRNGVGQVSGDSAKHPNAADGDGVTPQAQTAHNRRDTLGASEIAAVLGLDPYRTSHDIYLLKTGQVDEFEGNAATKRGTILEPALTEYACNELAVNLVGVQVRVVHHSGVLSATLDAWGYDPSGTPTLIEAKTTGLTEDWGEPGTDAVPEKVLVQVHHQMLCAGPHHRVCIVPVLLISFGNAVVEWFKVQRNDRLCEVIEKAGLDFMQAVAQRRSPPTPPSLAVVEKIRREPSKTVQVHESLVESWLAAKSAAKAAEDQADAARRDLLAAMGDAEIGESSAGTVTYGETKTTKFNLSRFKAEQPDVAATYIEQSTYRVLRHKKPK